MREHWAIFESPQLGRCEARTLRGTDELNRLFSFEILLVRPTGLSIDDASQLLSGPASLKLEEDGAVLGEYHGIVSDVTTEEDPDHDVTFIRLTMVPRAWLLTQRYGDEIFLGRTIPEVIADKLSAIGLVPGDDFVFSLLSRYPAREFIAQYRETDHAFISRLCEHAGIVTMFDCTAGKDVLVLSDTSTSFRPVKRPELLVRSRRDHPAAYGIKTTLRRVPSGACVHDYNYRSPRLELRRQQPISAAGSAGHWVDYGAHTKTADETLALAAVRTEELRAQHHVVEGSATEPCLHAGGLLRLVGNTMAEELLLTKVTFSFQTAQAAASEGGDRAGWDNRFYAIPQKVSYRPPRITPWPRVSGLHNAVIDGVIKGDYAELDEAGRYHLRMMNDRSGRTDLGATHPVRMMQPHAGPSYGMHFPLRPGTDVLVAFVNGDPDRPVIVGAAPNPVTSSPVERKNQTQNVLRSGSNNEIVMEDEHGIERIRIHTPHLNTTIQLGSIEEPEQGALTMTSGHLTEAARLTLNEASARRTTLANSSSDLRGRRAIVAAGLDAISSAESHGMEDPGSISLEALNRDLQKLSERPGNADDESAGDQGDSAGKEGDIKAGGLWSAVASAASESTDQAVFELLRNVAEATDDSADRARGRLQGEPAGQPMDPSAILASKSTAAMAARDTALVWGDRVAALSSHDTASVVGRATAQLKSPGAVEIAAGERTMMSSAGELSAEAELVRIVGGYYPEAEAPPLDEGTSVGIMSRRDFRINSVEDCILLCAKKNVIGSAHTGDMRLSAKKTVSISGGSIHGSAGKITLTSSGDIEVDADGNVLVGADGDIAVEAAGDVSIKGANVTIEGGTITLKGPVKVEGDLTVTGNINGG